MFISRKNIFKISVKFIGRNTLNSIPLKCFYSLINDINANQKKIKNWNAGYLIKAEIFRLSFQKIERNKRNKNLFLSKK